MARPISASISHNNTRAKLLIILFAEMTLSNFHAFMAITYSIVSLLRQDENKPFMLQAKLDIDTFAETCSSVRASKAVARSSLAVGCRICGHPSILCAAS